MSASGAGRTENRHAHRPHPPKAAPAVAETRYPSVFPWLAYGSRRRTVAGARYGLGFRCLSYGSRAGPPFGTNLVRFRRPGNHNLTRSRGKPPARLPACPPARLPACPPADLVRFRRPGNHKLTRSRGRPAAPPARLPARLPDCPAAVLVRFRRPGNHKLTRSRGRPTAPPAHLPTCESCAVSPQRQPQAHKIARKADGTTCPPAHVRILCGFAATATATSLDRAEGRRHRLAGWLAGDLVRFRRGGSHKLTRSVWRGRAVRCPGGGGAVFVGRAGRCGAGGGAVFVRRAVLGLREACGVCAGSCGGGLVRRGVIGGGRDHLLRSLGAGSVASPRRALGGSGGLYPPPRCDLKLILRGF
ncbi:hypothetical protein B0I29_101200 [Actinoplanes lutulentus]|uniref:Uncharacterized protein n=1 Tax=Actinoplanes lutulentus TaxID=1287878 RepID=A0A327ZKZ2_9ACTN|nr:hypothetical protein B0I29_101200 [Actinoplanes lutulentus]